MAAWLRKDDNLSSRNPEGEKKMKFESDDQKESRRMP